MREKHNGQRTLLAPASGLISAESAKITLGLTCVAYAAGRRHYVPQVTRVTRRSDKSRRPGDGVAA